MSDRSRPDGFTLVELLVVIVLMGIVATVIAAAATVILRTQGPTNTQVQDSRTLHGLTIWLAQDASATAPGDFDLSPTAPTGCVGASPGTNLVRMDWWEDTGTPVHYVANYRFVDQGGGDYRIERHTCSGPGPGPHPDPTVVRLGSRLGSSVPNVTSVGSPVVGVTIEMFTPAGESIFVDGDSRNPSETLPPTTTTTTTTVPSGPCALVALSADRNPVANQGSGVKRLQSDVTVTIRVSGACGAITLRYDRDGAGPQPLQTEAVSGIYPNYSVVLESDAAQTWSEGPHPLNVFDGSTLLNTTTYDLVVT